MNINKALSLKEGDIVHFPADRGDPAGYGRVTHVQPGPATQKNIYGVEYVWGTVTLPYSAKRSTVWPSNRLG